MTTTPQSGYMLRLERDAEGHLRAVPDSRTYHEATGAPDSFPDATADAERDAERDADAHGRPWRIWRATDPEPGAAPAFDALDALARTLWFGERLADDDAACRSAWGRLCSWIVSEYPGCHAKQTPGATGLSLVQHTLPWGKGQRRAYVYPTLPADLARLLAATAPQHRMEGPEELLTTPGATMRRYTQYDARIAHAAYLRHLPVLLGEDTSSLMHDEGPFIPYRAGKYRVAVTVPQGWSHIGLVHRAVTTPLGGTWDYPATPGEEWETWLDAGEVALLAKNDHAPWPFAVRERLLWADAKTPGTDPLREHSDRITSYLERLDRERARPAQTPTQARALAALRHAARAVALHPIGLWHKSSNQRPRHVASLDELTPADAEATIVPAEHGGYTVTVSAALSGYQAHWRRLEWSTTIYARERVNATRRALTAPRASVLGIRGDAVHFADYAPEWPDTGKVGAYRLKADVRFWGPRRAPRTAPELLALAQEGES